MFKKLLSVGLLSFLSIQVSALEINSGQLIELSVITSIDVQKQSKVLLSAMLVGEDIVEQLPEYCIFTATAQEDASKLLLTHVRCVDEQMQVLNADIEQALYLKQGQEVPKCEYDQGICKLVKLKENVQYFMVLAEPLSVE